MKRSMQRRANDSVTESAPQHDLPHVVVLMATYNGMRWLDEQVESILDQQDVQVTLVVSDDGSEDGTIEYLTQRARADPRIRILARRSGPPGVAANFLYLFRASDVPGSAFVALSDQDDVWHRDKLKRQISLLSSAKADAVSSNVTSFDDRGRRRVIVKSLPQRRWDYLFEAAGPGSTYVFTREMHLRLVRALDGLDTSEFGVHDWLLYALARAVGSTWVIDSQSTVDYRQHDDNVLGEHIGVRAARARLSNLRSGFYRRQFLLTAAAVRRVGASEHDGDWLADLDTLISALQNKGLSGRWLIWQRRREIRRDPREATELALACLLGVW